MRLLVSVLAAAVLLAAGPARAPVPGPPARFAVAGLGAPVRVVTDRYGVPHIRAASLPDLYFAWGWVSARDRLWQMLARRDGVRGETWRWRGNAGLQADGAAQLFELNAHAARIWANARGDPACSMIERYCDGVNAYLDLCRSGARPWPPEVRRLGLRPANWRPEDVTGVIMALGASLDLSVPQVAERAEIAKRGRAAYERRHRFDGLWPYATIPDSAARRLARSRGARAAAEREPPTVDPGPRLLAQARRTLGPERLARDLGQRASNVFAVGPRRSASGSPLFANDPHLALTAPNALHVVHVTVPGVIDAAGGCIAGIPSIVIGRNARCAWGVTSLSAPVTDLWADTLSRDGRRVLWRKRWVPVREAPFDLAYRVLGVPVPTSLLGRTRRYTPHGAVVAFDRRRGVALSARWAGAQDRVDLARILAIPRAASAAEVCAGFRALTTPAFNVVAADRDGHVRYQTVGCVPLRDFRTPPGALPGDGRWEWLGIVPADEMPAWDVPPAAFVVNANNAPLAARWDERFGDYDYPEDRALRIAERLGGAGRLTLADLGSVQNDVESRIARRTLPLLLAAADSLPGALEPRLRAAVDTLRRWDYSARRSRYAPTLWRAWYGAFLRRSRLEGAPGLPWAALAGRAPEALVDPRSGRPETRAAAATAALRLGLAELGRLLGPDPRGWWYGRAHRARFRTDLGRDRRAPGWRLAPIAVDGDLGTPCVGPSQLPWNPRVSHAPVLRHLVDLAVADSSLFVLPPGNSGDPGSPHSADLLEVWAAHGYVPLYLSWARIESAKESALELAPAPRAR